MRTTQGQATSDTKQGHTRNQRGWFHSIVSKTLTHQDSISKASSSDNSKIKSCRRPCIISYIPLVEQLHSQPRSRLLVSTGMVCGMGLTFEGFNPETTHQKGPKCQQTESELGAFITAYSVSTFLHLGCSPRVLVLCLSIIRCLQDGPQWV